MRGRTKSEHAHESSYHCEKRNDRKQDDPFFAMHVAQAYLALDLRCPCFLDFDADVADVAKPEALIFPETALKQSPNRFGGFCGQAPPIRFYSQDSGEDFGYGFTFECDSACEHLV